MNKLFNFKKLAFLALPLLFASCNEEALKHSDAVNAPKDIPYDQISLHEDGFLAFSTADVFQQTVNIMIDAQFQAENQLEFNYPNFASFQATYDEITDEELEEMVFSGSINDHPMFFIDRSEEEPIIEPVIEPGILSQLVSREGLIEIENYVLLVSKYKSYVMNEQQYENFKALGAPTPNEWEQVYDINRGENEIELRRKNRKRCLTRYKNSTRQLQGEIKTNHYGFYTEGKAQSVNHKKAWFAWVRNKTDNIYLKGKIAISVPGYPTAPGAVHDSKSFDKSCSNCREQHVTLKAYVILTIIGKKPKYASKYDLVLDESYGIHRIQNGGNFYECFND